jgi:hypothetical protein
MDLIAPFVKTGVISETVNLALAVPIGFLFGFGLFHAGFTDSRKIAGAFYLKDATVPVVMFSAIVTSMLGLWGLSLVGFVATSEMYFVPTYLMPAMVGGVLFGIGMVIGGYCPGTAVASMVTGKLDAVVYFIGFLIGSLVFGDLFPWWADFYRSDYRGVFRLDQLFDISLGWAVFLVVVIAVVGSLVLRVAERTLWSAPKVVAAGAEPVYEGLKLRRGFNVEAGLVVLALLLGLTMVFFPTSAFISDEPQAAPYYIIPKASGDAPIPAK